jgi:hypothetical protein
LRAAGSAVLFRQCIDREGALVSNPSNASSVAVLKSLSSQEGDGPRNAWLCALLMIVCVVVAYPVAEIGFIDDWSYVRTAQLYAQTGHMVYNGWSTAMLGWQILWGALFIKLLGFSFTALRISMLPLAALTVYLFNRILARCGVNPRNAVIGTLTFALCPLFIALTASYMSDIPGLLCIVLCLYLCLRALQASGDRHTILWLCAAAIINVAGGTVRQIAWLGALVIVPATAWMLRKRRGVLLSGFLLWPLCAIGIFLFMNWFKQQPYALPETFFTHSLNFQSLVHLASQMVKAFLCLSLITLPILAGWLPLAIRFTPGRKIMILAALAALVIFWALIPKDDGGDSLMMPWVTHLFSTMGTRRIGDILGVKPVNLGVWPRIFISAIVAGTTIVFFIGVWDSARKHTAGDIQAPRREWSPSWSELFWLIAPLYLSYVGLLMFRALFLHISIFDRYLIPLLALNIILLLRLYQQTIAERIPALTIWVVAAFAVYGVAGVHDWYALQRARVEAAKEIQSTGVPRSAIRAGFEFDGWTQITTAGHVNDPHFRPSGYVTRWNAFDNELPKDCTSWFSYLNEYFQVVDPKYYVSFTPLPCFTASQFSPITYHAWLPPFHRQLYIQQRKR